MRKSMIYKYAIMAVIDYPVIDAERKIPLLEQLLNDKSIAVWQEEQEAKKAQEEANNG